MKNQPLSDTQIQRLCDLYQQDIPWSAIRTTLNITDSTIIRHLRSCGIRLRRNYGKGTFKASPQTIEEICVAYRSGTSRKDICNAFDIDEGTLSSYLRSRDVPFRGNRHHSMDVQRQICLDYESNVRLEDIILRYHTSAHMIEQLIAERHIPKRPRLLGPQNQNKLTQIQIGELVDQYTGGTRPNHLRQQHGISNKTLFKYLKENDVPTQYLRNAHLPYFRCIDGRNKAYWLGFIAADGCVYTKGYRNDLQITLSRKDRGQLAQFVTALGVSNRIYDVIGHSNGHPIDVSTIRISSMGMICDLQNLGIKERKTFSLKWPSIPEDFESDFIRGYVDGDGCWWVNKKAQLYFNVIGCSPFILSLQNRLAKHCMLKLVKLKAHRTTPGISTLEYGGNKQCLRIANYLYAGADCYLPRKRSVVINHYASLPQYVSSVRFIDLCR